MNKYVSFRADNDTCKILEKLQKELKVTKSDIIRMAILNLKNQIEKVNR